MTRREILATDAGCELARVGRLAFRDRRLAFRDRHEATATLPAGAVEATFKIDKAVDRSTAMRWRIKLRTRKDQE